MELQKHSVWDVPNLEEFKKRLLEDVFLKKEVPEEIKEQLKVIEKLMIHCYYEYDFIDVAMLQAIITLEKALKIRYEELGNTLTKRTSFEDLINWALDKQLFEDLNPDLYHGLRNIRNEKVHKSKSGKGGILYLKGVYRIFDFVNDLYEDVDLRVKRQSECKNLQEEFEKRYPNGLIFTLGDKRWIGYKVVPAFINNKKTVPELSLSISRIFDPNKYSGNYGKPDNCIELAVKNWRFEENGFNGIDLENNLEFNINNINDPINMDKYLIWRNACEEKGNFSLVYFEAYFKHGYIESLRALHRLS